jgi:uncharacterized membrane protein
MNKLDYIAALKSALTGLPPELIAETLNTYEMRFIEGMSAGRSDTEIANDLGNPEAIAAKLKANQLNQPSAQMIAPQPKKPALNFFRIFFSLIGLSIFNLFMLIPGMVFFVMLMSSYIVAAALFVAGIAFTAGSMAGVNEMVIDCPWFSDNQVIRSASGVSTITSPHLMKLQMDQNGMCIEQEPSSTANAAHGKNQVSLAGGNVSLMDTFKGIGVILSGILLFLMSLVITKYTFIAIKKYAQVNYAILLNR